MKASERSIVIPVVLGSIFEWYEVFLYIYWIPIISRDLLDLSLPLAEFLYAVIILSVGLIARPIGGMFFGYIGDKYGRRIAFLSSIILITIPSFGVALMPSFETWAYFSLVYMGLMRFLQGIPAGGELPGALCILAEGAEVHRKRYMCSYLFVGPQIGQMLSMLQCFLLEKYLNYSELVSWGWRISFLIAGVIGILGFFLRKILHETIPFNHLKTDHKIEEHPLKETFAHHKKNLVLAFLISVFEVIGFFMIYFYLFQKPEETLGLKGNSALFVYLAFLVSLTVAMPIIGKLGDRYSNRHLFNISALGISISSILFFLSSYYGSLALVFAFLVIMASFFCIQFSLLPSLLADLFPTRVRFTCIGFSFNISDGVIGGIAPYLGIFMTFLVGSPASFSLLFPFLAVIYLISMKFVKVV